MFELVVDINKSTSLQQLHHSHQGGIPIFPTQPAIMHQVSLLLLMLGLYGFSNCTCKLLKQQCTP